MLGRIHSNFHFCVDDANVYCENGQALSIYGDFCHECQECPITVNSYIALTSNCSKSSNHFCPMTAYSSKICTDEVNVSLYNGTKLWRCPKANRGLNFEQSYDDLYVKDKFLSF